MPSFFVGVQRFYNNLTTQGTRIARCGVTVATGAGWLRRRLTDGSGETGLLGRIRRAAESLAAGNGKSPLGTSLMFTGRRRGRLLDPL